MSERERITLMAFDVTQPREDGDRRFVRVLPSRRHEALVESARPSPAPPPQEDHGGAVAACLRAGRGITAWTIADRGSTS